MSNLGSSRRGRVIRWIAIGTAAAILILVAVTALLYFRAVERFEIRRVSLPTRVYADLFPLRPGVVISAEAMLGKLRRLGYRETDGPPTQPGQYHEEGKELDLFLRGFDHPTGSYPERRIRVVFVERRIDSVSSIPEGEPVETAALEPELLASILGEQLESRTPVSLDQIPEDLVDAVLVTEDARFFQHPGVDPIGISRALFRNVRAGQVSEGGSTLTQQLVKNYYLTNERTMRRKVVEAFMAVVLDARYSKREILEAYMNDIYLGRDRSISIIGMGQASRFYFGKTVSEIELHEAALLAGIIRSPNNYSPFDEPDRTRERRNRVLRTLLGRERITSEEYEEALEAPLPEEPSRERSGLASIPFYVDAVLAELGSDYGIDDVRGRGLALYTAIDLEWQDAAAKHLEDGLSRLERSSARIRRNESPLEGALIAVDIETGEIRALVGGRDYIRSQFNRALHAERQVGSLFKPFVYLAAFEPSLSGQNITPATLVNDSRFVLQRRFARDWSPRNYEGTYEGVVTVRRALEQSLNAASVRLGLATGVEAIIRTARTVGVEAKMEPHPSLILGAAEIPPIQMASSYTTLARMGSRIPLRTIRHITADRGRVVSSGEDLTAVQVFPARDVYLVVHLMEGVMRRGTAARARSLGFRQTAAGKTGTTNEKRDAWFVGFTPDVLALTWIGFDDNSAIGLSGSEAAVPLWARFMIEATRLHDDREFSVPSGIVFSAVDSSSGGLATPYCPSHLIIQESFKSGTQPFTPCQIHQPPEPEFPDLEMPEGWEDDLLEPFDPSREIPDLEGGIFREEGAPRPDPTLPPPASTSPPPFPERSPLPPTTAPPETQPERGRPERPERERPPVREPRPERKEERERDEEPPLSAQSWWREKTIVALVPPNPKELQRACRTSARRA